MGRFGNEGLFLFMAAIGGLTSLAALVFRRESSPAHEPYRTMGRSTPVIAELDPRGHAEEESTSVPHEETNPDDSGSPSPTSVPDDSAEGDSPDSDVVGTTKREKP